MKLVFALFLCLFLGLRAYGQDSYANTVDTFNFKVQVELMVDSLNMTDSVEVQFFEIYNEYGETMKYAYENREGWIDLYQTYKWAIGVRDEKMIAILSDDQFAFFIKRQKEIEREAKDNR